MITLITMSQGNPIALKRTIDSFAPYCDEVIYGDLCVFQEDRTLIKSYKNLYNMKIVTYPFNYIFKNGFSTILNSLASCASNDHVLYMNVGEIVDPRLMPSFEIDNGLYNCYLNTHFSDPHHWYRMYNRQELEWGNLIHEELKGKNAPYNPRPCTAPSFMMDDTEKDIDNPFKTKVYNDIKELVYFYQYLRLVEEPDMVQGTNPGWVQYAKDAYDSLSERIVKKEHRYFAFQGGNYFKYMDDIFENPEFQKERMESSDLVNLQGDRMLL